MEALAIMKGGGGEQKLRDRYIHYISIVGRVVHIVFARLGEIGYLHGHTRYLGVCIRHRSKGR